MKNWQKSVKNHFFWTPGPQKGPKIKKSAKFPSNVWKTHKMQQLGQKWGSKTYLEPKNGWPNLGKRDFFYRFLPIFLLWAPKKVPPQTVPRHYSTDSTLFDMIRQFIDTIRRYSTIFDGRMMSNNVE